MAIEFSERIRRIPVYPVADGYALGDDMAMLASNESPDPPLPAVVAAAHRALAGANRYPDPSNATLKRALSKRYGVPPARIAIGNGSCDILLAAGDALLEPGAELVYAWPSFSVYPHLAAASGASAITVALRDDHFHDLDAMAAEITAATRLVIVCNPNNPTSFSKVYGLCGLRVGFALCGSDDFPRAVDQVRQPFFCNAAAQAAAIEALRHQDAVAERVERAIVARVELEAGLDELGISAAPSQTNFCWLELPEGSDEQAVVRGLAERGVLVRAGAALGRAGALRVTYGTPQQNARFLDALARVL